MAALLGLVGLRTTRKGGAGLWRWIPDFGLLLALQK